MEKYFNMILLFQIQTRLREVNTLINNLIFLEITVPADFYE